jgi:hypothetical protein
MGIDLSIIKQYDRIKKKRTLYLFFLLSLLLIPLFMWIIMSILNTDTQFRMLLLLPVLLVLFVLFMFNYSKMLYVVMQYEYYKMLMDDCPPLPVKHKLFTQSWLNHIQSLSFEVFVETDDVVIYHKVIKKINKMPTSGKILTCIVIAKHQNFDFYGTLADSYLNTLLTQVQDKTKVNKLIVLQFKKYPEWSQEAKQELNQIINYKAGQQSMIHLSVGYFLKQNQMYMLRPMKRYPSKHYYLAVMLAQQLSFIGSEEVIDAT